MNNVPSTVRFIVLSLDNLKLNNHIRHLCLNNKTLQQYNECHREFGHALAKAATEAVTKARWRRTSAPFVLSKKVPGTPFTTLQRPAAPGALLAVGRVDRELLRYGQYHCGGEHC